MECFKPLHGLSHAVGGLVMNVRTASNEAVMRLSVLAMGRTVGHDCSLVEFDWTCACASKDADESSSNEYKTGSEAKAMRGTRSPKDWLILQISN